MSLVANPFSLLNDESAEPEVAGPKKAVAPAQKAVVAPKQVVGKTPLKEKTGNSGAGKPVQRKGPRDTTKAGDFEEKPEHKEASASAPKEKTQRRKGREFDRRSNYPAKNGEEKKEVAGKASWGSEVEAQLEAAAEGGAAAADEEVVAAEPDPEDSFKSLADYRAEKEAARVATESKVRKPNEGVDESQWKKLTLVNKSGEDEVFFVGKNAAEKDRKSKDKSAKTVVQIEQTFAPPPREPRAERVRGGKAPRGKGEGAVNVMDPNAFPAL
ncbi:hypothetical protein HDV03_004095 [Kappamyces sp. JEL0829]|nr:hypothetical protein HDV03_004095 [Kappamyces sp. JEL0829]